MADSPTKYDVRRFGLAIIVALAFVAGGLFIPTIYYEHAPSDTFFRMHDLHVEDADTGDTSVALSVDYWANDELPARATLNLYREANGTREFVASETHTIVLEQGRNTITHSFGTKPLPPGTYHMVLELDVLRPRGVVRTLAFQSGPFAVTNESTPTAADSIRTATPTPTPPPRHGEKAP